MAGHLTHGNVNPSVRNHPFSLLALRRRNAIQTFQPLFCVRAHCAKRRSVEIAHLIAAGNTACKRIFVHAAVQAQIHLPNSALNMRFCRRHGKCNRARLRHAQGRFHVLIDQLRQTLHRALPFYADCTPDERPPQHTKQACRGERYVRCGQTALFPAFAQDATRKHGKHLRILNGDLAVDHHTFDAVANRLVLLVGGVVVQPLQIDHQNVRLLALG